MKIVVSKSFISNNNFSTASVGKFEAFHIGHQAIIEQMKSIGGQTTLLCFYPNPNSVLFDRPDNFIYPVGYRTILSRRLGIDNFIRVRFNKKFSELSAEVFIEKYLVKKLNINYLVLGSDAAFGRERRGDLSFLRSFLPNKSIKLFEVEKSYFNNLIPSTRKITELLTVGDLDVANYLLGRPFSLFCKVVSGNALGRKIGFPTANLAIHKKQILPKNGVYSIYCRIGTNWYRGVAHLGPRPSINCEEIRVEIHLTNYKGGDFYNIRIEVLFLGWVRELKKFKSLLELKEQIGFDIIKADNLIDSYLERNIAPNLNKFFSL
jgi:riboflavin kinase / FMN adenylyltransferase